MERAISCELFHVEATINIALHNSIYGSRLDRLTVSKDSPSLLPLLPLELFPFNREVKVGGEVISTTFELNNPPSSEFVSSQ